MSTTKTRQYCVSLNGVNLTPERAKQLLGQLAKDARITGHYQINTPSPSVAFARLLEMAANDPEIIKRLRNYRYTGEPTPDGN